jgi:sugar phosphate isomerase/epimerase
MNNRRNFIKSAGLATAAIGLGIPHIAFLAAKYDPLFKMSLAEWSLNKQLFSGKMDHLDFAKLTKKAGIDAVEYVNQFFKDKATDMTYLKEMKSRADGEGVRSVLIMCDGEGMLGAATAEERTQTVNNHKKWVEAAKFLGCHSVRVNAYSAIPWSTSKQDYTKASDLASAGLRELCEFADDFDINVLIENHGGFSSNGKWLAEMIEKTDHPRAGTLPDFGNFRIANQDGEVISYDSYQGVEDLMPRAKGVSLKPTVWDGQGSEHPLDYLKMMKLVLSYDFQGYVGIEHGEEGREWESIEEIKKELEGVRTLLEKQA